MNNKLRQQILKEIKFLLNEAEAVDYSKAKSGGSYGSGPLGRGIATTATGLGAAGVAGAGAIGAGVGSAMGGTALGGAAAGIAGGVVFAPVAIGALALGAAYLAFRTAGWKEVAEDIDDANIVKDDEVAKRLSTKQYLDLTTMEDATDEADMKSFMAAMKGMAEAYAEIEELEEYKNFLEEAKAQKVRLDRICNNFVLLNEFGQNDRMYFVKCAKVAAYQPPTQAATVKESLKSNLFEADATPTQQTAQVAQQSKCVKVEGIQIPVVLYNIELENEISNSQKTFRAPAGELPAITCPLIEKLCGTGEQPAPTPAPSPAPVPQWQLGAQGKNSFKCKNKEDVAVFQQWLGVKEDCSVGIKTITAAKSKGLKLNLEDYFSAEGLSQKQIQNQFEFCNSLRTNREGYEAEIRKSGQEVRGKCPVAVSGGEKPSQKKNVKAPKAQPAGQDQTPAGPPSPNTPGARGAGSPAIEESKDFYEKKKLNESKKLFNKLLKKLG